jgi:hypothetical protein
VSLNGKASRMNEISQSDYIVRDLRDNTQIKWENVSQRNFSIAEITGYGFLKPTTISISGQVHYSEAMLSNGNDIEDVVTTILKRFSIQDNTSSRFYQKTIFKKYLEIKK